jgi:hypothetical protein
MAKTVGKIRSIAINDHKVSLLFTVGVGADATQSRFVLVDEPAGAHTIAPVLLAHRSWMIALLQNALLHDKYVFLTHDDEKRVRQVELYSELNFDFFTDLTDNEEDDGDSTRGPKRPDPLEEKLPQPPGGTTIRRPVK